MVTPQQVDRALVLATRFVHDVETAMLAATIMAAAWLLAYFSRTLVLAIKKGPQ